MRLSWLPRVKDGFFFRAETFDTFAGYIDELAKDPYVGQSAYAPYGGEIVESAVAWTSLFNFFEK